MDQCHAVCGGRARRVLEIHSPRGRSGMIRCHTRVRNEGTKKRRNQVHHRLATLFLSLPSSNSTCIRSSSCALPPFTLCVTAFPFPAFPANACLASLPPFLRFDPEPLLAPLRGVATIAMGGEIDSGEKIETLRGWVCVCSNIIVE